MNGKERVVFTPTTKDGVNFLEGKVSGNLRIDELLRGCGRICISCSYLNDCGPHRFTANKMIYKPPFFEKVVRVFGEEIGFEDCHLKLYGVNKIFLGPDIKVPWNHRGREIYL